MRFLIAWIGRSKLPEAAAWTEEYLTRIHRFARVAAEEIDARQGDAGLLRRVRAQSDRRLVAFDPAGKQLDSAGFADFLSRSFARDGREMVLAIGGADGFGPAVRAAAEATLSLSAMTYSHELARVMVAEQLYRALALLHGHPYPR